MKTEYDRLPRPSGLRESEDRMTVGIAALCNDRREIILCSDSEAGTPLAASDMKETKMRELAPGLCVLMAADPSLCQRVIDRSRLILSSKKQMPFRQMAEVVSEQYLCVKYQEFERQIIQAEGFASWQEYNSGLSQHDRLLLALIERGKALFALEAYLLLCSFEGKEGAIIQVSNYAINALPEAEGFAAIGAGQTHADAVLHSRGYHTGLSCEDAIPLVYEAKRLAEAARGVGKGTNLLILRPEGGQFVSEDGIRELRRDHDSRFSARGKFRNPPQYFVSSTIKGVSRRIEPQETKDNS